MWSSPVPASVIVLLIISVECFRQITQEMIVTSLDNTSKPTLLRHTRIIVDRRSVFYLIIWVVMCMPSTFLYTVHTCACKCIDKSTIHLGMLVRHLDAPVL